MTGSLGNVVALLFVAVLASVSALAERRRKRRPSARNGFPADEKARRALIMRLDDEAIEAGKRATDQQEGDWWWE